MKKGILAVLAVLLVTLVSGWSGTGAWGQEKAVYICQKNIGYTVQEEGVVVYITEYLRGDGPYAIRIAASNVVIDGQGNSIPIWFNGKFGGEAISISSNKEVSNIEIQNVVSKSGSWLGYSTKVAMDVININIHNNKLTRADLRHLKGGSVSNNELYRTTVKRNYDYGLFIYGASNLIVSGNKSMMPGTWILMDRCKNVLFQDNIANLRLTNCDSIYGGGNVIGKLEQENCTNICIDTVMAINYDNPETVYDYTLHQNYPNPFNVETVIRYQLSHTTHVILKIYNLLGQEIRALVDKEESTGEHAIRWDGKDAKGQDVTSGIYVYRIVAGQFAATKKMSFLK